MKIILILFFFQIFTINAQTSNYNGSWSGNLKQGDKNYAYWFKFKVDHFKVTGFGRTEIPNSNYYGLFKVVGYVKNDTLFFEESEVIKEKKRTKEGWCAIKGSLVFNKSNYHIAGEWYSLTPNCGTGVLNLNKTPREINLNDNLTVSYLNIDSLNYLKEFKVGERIILSKVFYTTNSSNIQPVSKKQLNEIVKILKLNRDLKISVMGYTDSDGNDEYNLDLSYLRALKIQTYLIDNGIEKERVVYEGYGEANPIFPNNNEINKAKNRRVEIEIISKK